METSSNERIKQYIIIRKDLNLRKGKIMAQSAHASLKIFLDMMKNNPNSNPNEGKFVLETTNPFMKDWISGQFIKIGLYVESEKELLDLYEKAQEQGLPCSLIQDIGYTEFHGVPTYTAIAIGPDDPLKLQPLTKDLKPF